MFLGIYDKTGSKMVTNTGQKVLERIFFKCKKVSL